jgi:hypothetical protein
MVHYRKEALRRRGHLGADGVDSGQHSVVDGSRVVEQTADEFLDFTDFRWGQDSVSVDINKLWALARIVSGVYLRRLHLPERATTSKARKRLSDVTRHAQLDPEVIYNKGELDTVSSMCEEAGYKSIFMVIGLGEMPHEALLR